MADEQLWTYIVRCATCGQECNRAEHVPERKRGLVAMGAPMMAFCAVEAHNTLSDLNYHYDAEWVPETERQRETADGKAV
ncbi:MAG: hypothetical protein IVW57_00320 [Ktedonobacterales bacterium]|nr:hypothetical protein [Ktedonobacterales bacterium]